MLSLLKGSVSQRLARSTAQAILKRTFAKKGFPADFAVKKNIFIEEWNGKREITNLTFKFRAEDIPTFLFLIILFPYGLYTVARMDLHNGGDRRFKELF